MCKIAICDDDKEYREKIKTVIETEGILSSNEIRFYEYESGKELLEDADILHDLIFMDMRMPGLDGNKTVLKLREYNEAAILVFCSGCFEPTPDSINVGQPFRYIMKDLHDRSLKKEIPMILLKVKLCCGDSSVTVTSAGRIMRIHTEDILYICLAKRGCTIYIARQGKIEEMANMICDKEIIALEPSAYMRTAFMARLMEHNEVKERISLLPIDVGKYSFRDKISGVMCMGVLGHLKRDEQEKLLYKLDKNLNINVPILIELLEPKFLVAPVGSRISVATQGRLRYETYITDIKQVGMDQWTWRLTYKVFCGKNIVSTVDSLMSWNYQSVEKILNQLTKMHFRTAKLSETLLLAIKAR